MTPVTERHPHSLLRVRCVRFVLLRAETDVTSHPFSPVDQGRSSGPPRSDPGRMSTASGAGGPRELGRSDRRAVSYVVFPPFPAIFGTVGLRMWGSSADNRPRVDARELTRSAPDNAGLHPYACNSIDNGGLILAPGRPGPDESAETRPDRPPTPAAETTERRPPTPPRPLLAGSGDPVGSGVTDATDGWRQVCRTSCPASPTAPATGSR